MNPINDCQHRLGKGHMISVALESIHHRDTWKSIALSLISRFSTDFVAQLCTVREGMGNSEGKLR